MIAQKTSTTTSTTSGVGAARPDAAIPVEELRQKVAAIDWWHRIDLGRGVVTPGRDATQEKLATLHLPERLDGATVLDIGAWNGFFSFEAERRGARRVLAIDSPAWRGEGIATRQGFDLARRALGSKVEDLELDVMELAPERVGVFDLVLMLGVLYHLEDPLGALRRVASVTRERLVLETHTDALWSRRPAAVFYPGDQLNRDPSNWWGPNLPALLGMLRTAGFARAEVVHRRSRARRLARAARLRLARPARAFLESAQQGRAVVHAWRRLQGPADS